MTAVSHFGCATSNFPAGTYGYLADANYLTNSRELRILNVVIINFTKHFYYEPFQVTNHITVRSYKYDKSRMLNLIGHIFVNYNYSNSCLGHWH